MPKLPIDINLNVKADLTKPVSDITTTLLSATSFVGKVLGAPIEAIGGILSDQIQFWRARNIERLRDKWLAIRAERNVSPEAIKLLPFNVGIRLIEAASQEDDDEVQTLWAGLLDSATDPNGTREVERIHIDILKSITGVEVRILKFLFLRIERNDNLLNIIMDSDVGKYAEVYLEVLLLKSRTTAIQNLRRQECVRRIPDTYLFGKIEEINDVLAPNINVSKERFIEVVSSIRRLIEITSGAQDIYDFNGEHRLPEIAFELTELGLDLMRTCIKPAEQGRRK